MRKYWKAIGLCLFSIVVLVGFYVQSSSYSKMFPEYSFQKISGDEAVGKSMLLNGNLNLSMLDGMSFQIDQDGTTYLRDEGFFKRLEGYYVSENMDRLRKQYRTFMRGKIDMKEYYFEDDTVVAYANTAGGFFTVHNSDFEIDVLEKASGKRTTFNLPIPEKEKFWWTDVAGIKVMDHTLYLVATADVVGSENEEIHQYTIDLASEKVIESELVETIDYKESTDNGYFTRDIVFSTAPTDTTYFIVEHEVRFRDMVAEDVQTEVSMINSLEIVDIVSGEKVQVDVPKEAGYPVAMDQDNVYFASSVPNKIMLAKYDVAAKKVVKETELPVDQSFTSLDDLYYHNLIQDHTFYFSTPYYGEGELPTVGAVDLATLEVTYLGKVERTMADPSDSMGWTERNMNVYMDEPDVKQR